MMSVLGIILFLLVVGIVLWMFPVEATIRKIIIGLVVIVCLVWLFGALGWVPLPALKLR